MKILALFFLCFISVAFCSSANFEIISGEVVFTKTNNLLDINSFSDKTHLKWDKFNVLANEKVNFNQPNENSCVLNQVTTSPSKNFGSIESNGKVFLLNPNGILFSKDAKINVASFIASTLNIEDIDSYFENEKMHFQDGDGFIVNLGTIEAALGDVYLISKNIENHGKILAKNGQVALGSGDKIIIRPKDNQRVYIESGIEDATIENFGTIKALQVELKSNNPYSFAINHTGIIDAKSVGQKGGKVYLIAKDSKINLKNQAKIYAKDAIDTLAEVQILADEIFIQDESIIDISSNNGGDNIYIGGGYQGKTPDLITSNRTYIGKDVKIYADAIENGTGSEVVIWSDKDTQYHGFISSKGGKKSGDGGLIEVSGKNNLIFEGSVDTKAPKGKLGTLLIDPSTINITSGYTAGGAFDGGSPTDTFNLSASIATINKEDVYNALKNANVVINSSSAFTELGDINFNSNFQYIASTANEGNLTINSSNDIDIGSYLTFCGHPDANQNLTLTAQNAIHILSTFCLTNISSNLNAKNITISSQFTLQNSGNVSFNATDSINFIVHNVSDMDFQNNATCSFNATNKIQIDGNFNCSNAASLNFIAPEINLGKSTLEGIPSLTFSSN